MRKSLRKTTPCMYYSRSQTEGCKTSHQIARFIVTHQIYSRTNMFSIVLMAV